MAKKADEAPSDEAPTLDPAPPGDHRFFGWIRSLGLERQPGWLGGVCAAIAARVGIDPVIVRGIVVVVAVLGGPALLLYAAAWLLLPDTNGLIHLEELLAGRIGSPIAGIGALLVLSLLPVTQGFWYLGSAYWGEPEWGGGLGRTLWTVGLLIGGVWLVVWFARRSIRLAKGGDAGTAHAGTAGAGAGTAGADAGTAAAATKTFPVVSAPPRHPERGASETEVSEWRQQQKTWKAEREAFRRERAASERETSRQRAEERRARSIELSAQRVEARRLRLVANPRAGLAFSAIALGSAAVAGGVAAAIASTQPQQADYRLTIALATAAVFLATAIIGAGVAGRRAGILGFSAVIVVLAMLVSAVLPPDRQLLVSGYGLSNSAPGRYLMLAGPLEIWVDETIATPDRTVDVWQGAGDITIWITPDTDVQIELASSTGAVLLGRNVDDPNWNSVALDDFHFESGAWRSTTTVGEGAEPDAILRIWLERGSVTVLQVPATDEEE